MDEYNIVDNTIGAKRGESGFSRSSNDVMVYIPEFYYKVVNDSSSSKRYFYIADKVATGFEKHPGSGRYVGRYNTYSGIYGNFSSTGTSPYVNITRDIARNKARDKGDKWALYDYASWCAVWLLYIIEYADCLCCARCSTRHSTLVDNANYGGGWRVLYVGGNWNNGSNAGLFYFNANFSSICFPSCRFLNDKANLLFI
jgi:hypothetical protein